jgi:hypothetical protein
VAVLVERERRAMVAEVRLNGFYIVPALERGHGATVPQVVESASRNCVDYL